MQAIITRGSRVWLILLVVVILSCFCSSTHAIIQKSQADQHVVMQGVSKFGIDHDGVVKLKVTTTDPAVIYNPEFTGALLSTKRHILTAAHPFDGFAGSAAPPFSVTTLVDFDFPGLDNPIAVEFSSVLFHFSYVPDANADFPRDSIGFPADQTGEFGGFDVAILELPATIDGQPTEEALADVPAYDWAQPGLDDTGGFVITGYGWRGTGVDGVTVQEFGTKVAGKNSLDGSFSPSTAPPFLTNVETMAFFDFDNGMEEANFIGDIGLGEDEVLNAPGDSGGPNFKEGTDTIVGVTSFEISSSKDQNPNVPYTFGELGASTRILGGVIRTRPSDGKQVLDSVFGFIDLVTGKGKHFELLSDGAFENNENWVGGSLPDINDHVKIALDTPTDINIEGPSDSFEISSLEVGGGVGGKSLLLRNGGAISMSGNDVQLKDYGLIQLSDGILTADKLVISSESDQFPAIFDFTGNEMDSTLNVNQIIVEGTGIFFTDRVGGGELDVDWELHGFFNGASPNINTDGQAFIIQPGRTLAMTGGFIGTPFFGIHATAEAHISDATDFAAVSTSTVVIAGTLHMDHGAVSTDDFDTGTNDGRFEVGLGGTTPVDDHAQVLALGEIDLGGTLALSLIDGYDQLLDYGDTFELIETTDGIDTGTINGIFETVEGVRRGAISLAVAYDDTYADPDHVPEVYARASLPGDVDLSTWVDLDDYEILSGNMYESGMSWSDGDVDGNGVVDFADFVLMALWFDEREGYLSMTAPPAPGSVGMLSSEMAFGSKTMLSEAVMTPLLADRLGIDPDARYSGAALEALLADMRALLVSGETAKLTASFAQIPEPGAAALVVIGLVGVLRRGRRCGHGC